MGDIDFTKVVDVGLYNNSLLEDRDDFDQMLNEAKSELQFYNWCLEILESYVGIFYAGVVGVFLFKIIRSSDVVDEWHWVVVGDLPPIHITCRDSPNAACALDAYIGEMQEWVKAAENNKSVAELVPVSVPATPENAIRLKSQLTMLDERVLSEYAEDLKTQQRPPAPIGKRKAVAAICRYRPVLRTTQGGEKQTGTVNQKRLPNCRGWRLWNIQWRGFRRNWCARRR